MPDRKRIAAPIGALAFTATQPDGTTIDGTVMNVGPGGVAVRLSNPLQPGDQVAFTLRLPDGRVVRGQGRVAWATGPEDAGLHFVTLDDYGRSMLNLWLKSQRPM